MTTTFAEWRRLGDWPGVYEALSDSLAHYAVVYRAKIAGYVFMPSHLHVVLFIDGKQLGPFMRDLKKFTAQKSLPVLGINKSPVWMPRYDRVQIEAEEILRIKLDYIHQNPVRAGLVIRPELWRWSSAADYLAGSPGPVPVWKDWA
ncbi:MAG: hypothetical protein AB1644_09675 [Candidatus Zixiibacteriota bacterium]